jgi:LAO/AO transport system kinase
VQLLKAGLLEIADLIVINKSDLDGANELYRSVLSTLGLSAPAADRPTVHQTSARDGVGIDALVDHLESALARDGSSWVSARTASLVRDVEDAIVGEALQRVRAAGLDGSSVAAGRQSVDEAVNALLDRARNERS